MRTIRLTLAYDGTNYAGWQVQPDRTTVQGTLEAVIEKVTGQQVRVTASGRTDAGVHALAQVAAFTTDSHLTTDVLQRALNAELPRDVAVLHVNEAADGFHPIRDALRKRYRYVIHDGSVRDTLRRGQCWQYVHGRLDVDAMQRAARALLGTHDFSSFETTGAERLSSVRTIYDLPVERGRAGGGDLLTSELAASDLVTVEVEADGFLYNMVRAIVGTLVDVGRGAREESWVADVLDATDRRVAGPTAPPEGLFLVRVEYE
ncbi:MAG: tRNA pseudouridine(38-40) synthase TruA [Candidatus Nealsonbacteria bacterium]|nr:tRNA pseudouridine(38-40) synthase TruA [Candidatus Nealsonbacteria bacterium]